MGLYSNTRLSSLNEYASAEFKRTSNVESLIETCISIRENDYKMFSTLLNLDFAEASMLNESDGPIENDDYDAESMKRDSKNTADSRKASAEIKRRHKQTEEEAAKQAEEDKYEATYGSKSASQQDVEDNEVGPDHIKSTALAKQVNMLNEKKKESIWKKIANVFETVINAIKGFFEKAITKIGEVIRRDKAITEKYKDAFTADKIEGFGGIEGFAKPKMDPTAMKNQVDARCQKLVKDLNSAVDKALKASTKDDVSNISEDLSKEAELAGKGLDELFFETYSEDKGKFVPDASFMAIAYKSIGERTEIVKNIKELKSTLENQLKDEKNKISSKQKELKDNKAGDVQIAVAAATFKMAQSFSRGALKLVDSYIKNTVKAFGSYRKAVILVGKYVTSKKEDKKEDKKEANASYKFDLTDFAIAEASDLYVYESILA